MTSIPENFQPMLSGKAPDDLSTLKFPLLVSPKLDGIRCIMWGGVAYSRKLKPIPNAFIQAQLAGLPDGLDGELIVGSPTNQGPNDSVMQRTSSGVMSHDGEPGFTFYVFDCLWGDPAEGFQHRYATVCGLRTTENPHVHPVTHYLCEDVSDVMAQEARFVDAGYEGIMLRDPDGAYKFGRSTTKEGGLLKLKRFFDDEAMVVGFVEQMHNTNEKLRDERGYAKRSSAKAGKVPNGMLGALKCSLGFGKPMFEIGTGFTAAQRKDIWDNRESYLGKLVKFKYQELTPDSVPRFSVFLDWRSEIDA